MPLISLEPELYLWFEFPLIFDPFKSYMSFIDWEPRCESDVSFFSAVDSIVGIPMATFAPVLVPLRAESNDIIRLFLIVELIFLKLRSFCMF
jgi:hypothetical protein